MLQVLNMDIPFLLTKDSTWIYVLVWDTEVVDTSPTYRTEATMYGNTPDKGIISVPSNWRFPFPAFLEKTTSIQVSEAFD